MYLIEKEQVIHVTQLANGIDQFNSLSSMISFERTRYPLAKF